MNLEKGKSILRKINALVDNLDDHGTVAILERDLLLNYLRELYEVVLENYEDSGIRELEELVLKSKTQQTAKPDNTGVSENPQVPVAGEASATREETAGAKSESEHALERSEQGFEMQNRNAGNSNEPVAETTPLTSVTAAVKEPIQVETRTGLGEIFEISARGEVVDNFQLQALEAIEHGLGINDRLLTINELFGGDETLFNNTVSRLNNMDSYDDARNYLESVIATQYEWAKEDKMRRAKQFARLVKRRFPA